MIVFGLIIWGALTNNADSPESTAGGTEGGEAASACLQPAAAWLQTLQGGFYHRYRNAAITSSAYVETETTEGTAYYVAVEVEGISGVAVFGTSDPPIESDPGLIAGANAPANELSNAGIDIPEDSSAGALLLDDGGTLAAEACL